MDHETNVAELKRKVQDFCEERDWDQFHGAKELAIGISTEAAELLQHFRFKDEEQIKEIFSDPEKKGKVKEEVADVLFFLLRLSQMYDVDLTAALDRKLEKNSVKYPVEKCKGSNKRYSEF